jgi:hypothetical protein
MIVPVHSREVFTVENDWYCYFHDEKPAYEWACKDDYHDVVTLVPWTGEHLCIRFHGCVRSDKGHRIVEALKKHGYDAFKGDHRWVGKSYLAANFSRWQPVKVFCQDPSVYSVYLIPPDFRAIKCYGCRQPYVRDDIYWWHRDAGWRWHRAWKVFADRYELVAVCYQEKCLQKLEWRNRRWNKTYVVREKKRRELAIAEMKAKQARKLVEAARRHEYQEALASLRTVRAMLREPSHSAWRSPTEASGTHATSRT